MGAHDTVANTQAEPGTFAGLLGGVKGIEDALGVSDSSAIVRDGHFYGVAPQARTDSDAPTVTGLLYRVISVIENVQENLLQLLRIAERGRQILIEFLNDFYSVTGEIVTSELDGLPQHVIDLHQLALYRTLPRETQQILHDVLGALRFLQDDLQIFARVFWGLRILKKEIGEAKNRRPRVIDLVSPSGNQAANGCHFFGVREFGLQKRCIGDVGHHHHHAVYRV